MYYNIIVVQAVIKFTSLNNFILFLIQLNRCLECCLI